MRIHPTRTIRKHTVEVSPQDIIEALGNPPDDATVKVDFGNGQTVTLEPHAKILVQWAEQTAPGAEER